MREGDLTYDDFLQRLSIQEVLIDAGYHLNRRDGLRYPSYVRLDSDGRRIRGDKFIVTQQGKCCFQAQQQRVYNIISFIKEHPHFFSEYRAGMSGDRLVNLVCNRLLNHPIENRDTRIIQPKRDIRPFNLDDYDIHKFNPQDRETQKKFYPYFKHRGIDLYTQYAFHRHFCLAAKHRADGATYTNLAFPLNLPKDTEKIVGFEERGRARMDGSGSYKGKAEGSNSSEGLWIASPAKTLPAAAQDIYWFESAYDAMAYYQLHQKADKELRKALFVSTGGSPSQQQFKALIKAAPNACHHLCFDRDRAGKVFAVNFALTHAGKVFTSNLTEDGRLSVQINDEGNLRHEINLKSFDFQRIITTLCPDSVNTNDEVGRHILYEPAADGYKDWNDQLLGKRMESEEKELDEMEISGKATLNRALAGLPEINPEHIRSGRYDKADHEAVQKRLERADRIIFSFELNDQGMTEKGFQEMHKIREELARLEKDIENSLSDMEEENRPHFHR